MLVLNRISLLSKEIKKKYVALKPKEFDRRATLAMKALGASAVVFWRDIAKSTFSANTFKQYLEGMSVDVTDDHVKFYMAETTVGSLLEYGMDPMDNFGSYYFRRSGGKKVIIPFDDYKVRRYENYPREQYFSDGTLKSVEQIKFSLLGISDRDLVSDVEYNLRAFRSSSAASSYNTRAFRRFNDTSEGQFRTLKPHHTWKHPGVRKAMIIQQVAAWIEMTKSSFTQHLFEGDAEVEI